MTNILSLNFLRNAFSRLAGSPVRISGLEPPPMRADELYATIQCSSWFARLQESDRENFKARFIRKLGKDCKGLIRPDLYRIQIIDAIEYMLRVKGEDISEASNHAEDLINSCVRIFPGLTEEQVAMRSMDFLNLNRNAGGSLHPTQT